MNASNTSYKTGANHLQEMDNVEHLERLTRMKTLPVLLPTLMISTVQEEGRLLADMLVSVPNVKLTHVSTSQVDASYFQAHRLLVLQLPADHELALQMLESYAGKCEYMLVVGEHFSPELMREAMKAGARDYLPLYGAKEELFKALFDVADAVAKATALAPTFVVLNSKGGCGASFLAAAIADQFACRQEDLKVALVDGDHVQAGQSHLLNQEPEYFFHHALAQAEELDESALIGMMSQLENLHLLSAAPFSQQDRTAVNYLQLPQLMFKLRSCYQAVVVDLSRGPENWANPILMEATTILLVMQDSLASLRSATATVNHLINDLGVARSRIQLVYNRYSPKNRMVSLADAKSTSGVGTVFTVRNDFQRVNTCLDEGRRLSRFAAKEQVTRDVAEICQQLIPMEQESQPAGFWTKLWR
ncbi:AAA family ATPase [Ferrimonas balearica]|uniref:AAA family ATPase n=1 Tax=Ferrimonas balearica TaxID=44012 RepID=UPI001F406AC7|nr:hypothetical protein [Ferrimonas balearica]MBY6019799.1 hypothetical protein [Halomonas denitrificans]MBY6096866.1 hypothetical protein [Ferrimonas balearica]